MTGVDLDLSHPVLSRADFAHERDHKAPRRGRHFNWRRCVLGGTFSRSSELLPAEFCRAKPILTKTEDAPGCAEQTRCKLDLLLTKAYGYPAATRCNRLPAGLQNYAADPRRNRPRPRTCRRDALDRKARHGTGSYYIERAKALTTSTRRRLNHAMEDREAGLPRVTANRGVGQRSTPHPRH